MSGDLSWAKFSVGGVGSEVVLVSGTGSGGRGGGVVEGAPHRGEVGEAKEGGRLLLGDLGLDVDGCDVWEGKSFGGAVTALSQDHVLLPSLPCCGGDARGCSGRRYCSPHVCSVRCRDWLYTAAKEKDQTVVFWEIALAYPRRSGWICLVAARILQDARTSDSVSLSSLPPPSPPPMKQPGAARKPYNGPKKALAIALDVGTTFSGVSYALLDPGEIPKIYEVTRYAPRVPSPPHFPFTLSDDLRPFISTIGADIRGLT